MYLWWMCMAHDINVPGFSNVPWHKRAFGPGTKYVFLKLVLGILGALCKGKGAPLVRYLCTTWESLRMFFTEMSPSGGTKYVSFEFFWAFVGTWGGERERPWYGTFAKPWAEGHSVCSKEVCKEKEQSVRLKPKNQMQCLTGCPRRGHSS